MRIVPNATVGPIRERILVGLTLDELRTMQDVMYHAAQESPFLAKQGWTARMLRDRMAESGLTFCVCGQRHVLPLERCPVDAT